MGLDAAAFDLAQRANSVASLNEAKLRSGEDILQTVIIQGIATDGLNGFLEDTTKEWQTDSLIGQTLKVDIVSEDTIYHPVITSNTATKVYFTPIELPTGATITLGAGGETEGQVTVTLIGDLIGTAGNDYSLEIVNGNTNTGFDYIELDSANKKFIVTVDTNSLGQTRELMSGSMSVIIADNSEVAAVLEAGSTFDPGLIPLTTTPIPFTGGDDGIYVSAGDTYEIAYSVTLENLEGTKISYSDIVNDDTTGGEAVPASAEIVKVHGTSISELSDLITVAAAANVYTLDMAGGKHKNFKIVSSDANAKTITIANPPASASSIVVSCLIVCTTAAAFTHTGVTYAAGNPSYTTGQSYQETYDSIDGGTSYAGYSTRRT